MNILFMIVCAVIVIGFLVFIHEGGHYIAARAFGVRVTEFMLGLPGPSVGFTWGGTRFGVTAVPLGGYARVCGMEPGEMSPYLKEAMQSVYKRGSALMEEVAADCSISEDEAMTALDELVEWGTITGPNRKDEYNMYRTPQVKPTKHQINKAKLAGLEMPQSYEAGAPREISNLQEFYEQEYKQQYRALPFWKRSIILLAGIATNLIFAVLAFVIIYSIIGINITDPVTGEVKHMNADIGRSIMAGFGYIGMTVQAILGLFNPSTAAETVSNSTSIVGIAVMSADYFAAGFQDALFFMAVISISLGLMNLLPIPPLDGGRFFVEIIQKVSRRQISPRVLNGISMAGMILFLGFFAIMLNQDIQRFIFGNW